MAKVEGKVMRREGLVVSWNLYPSSCHRLPVHSQCVYAVGGKVKLSQSAFYLGEPSFEACSLISFLVILDLHSLWVSFFMHSCLAGLINSKNLP